MTQSRKERMSNILDRVVDMYAQFLSIVEDEILDPLSKGDKDQCRENLRKFGKRVTVSELVRIFIRGATLLSPLVSKYDEEDKKGKPRLSEEYMAKRLEHFKDRIAKLNKQGA